jgi:hypothetical protein
MRRGAVLGTATTLITAEADEGKKTGYTELPLSYPIRLGGFVGGILERKVVSTPEVSQPGPAA